MTHEKFIELLNLYLDGSLPPAEAAALEREIHGNVQRRRIYRQYCQMQKACTHLSERFREEAAPAARFRAGAVVGVSRRASGEWMRAIALVAGGALAACAVFVGLRLSVAPESGAAVVQTRPVAASVSTAAVHAINVAASVQTVAATTAVALNNPAVFNTPWATTQRPTQRMVGFNQSALFNHPVQLAVPELKLPAGAKNLPIDLQPYGMAPGTPLRMEELEAAAFQFQR